MLGLYIHIPFCKSKCGYCDFVSYEGKDSSYANSYLKALTAEMSRYTGKRLSTVYLGGGTPSILSVLQFELLISTVFERFDCSELNEFTVEFNPESATKQKINALRILGVNRLSIGAQSFCDRELKYLKRAHNCAQVRECFSYARDEGFSNISLDLMYGFPGQAEKTWKDSLAKAVSLGPEHISLYPLTVEEGTPFHEQKVETCSDVQASMFEYAIDFLQEAGYMHYEISNWAKPGYESRHNLNYWNCGQYLGIGVSASSHMDNTRWKNISVIEEYVSAVGRGESVIAESEELDDRIRAAEAVILPLRCASGAQITNDLKVKFASQIEKLIKESLIYSKDSRISLTRKGILLANQVMKEFV